ncbi:hypothetical protein E2C01_071417 [Portunus trituberculatus]|uniref:Uncharacterized protein n=1 Tax=Portunus trituberculatus TaxID=210409 RepID=A0A5B7HWY6_PORTR|nr:hypothetical protein [Portunus trituberculatus]
MPDSLLQLPSFSYALISSSTSKSPFLSFFLFPSALVYMRTWEGQCREVAVAGRVVRRVAGLKRGHTDILTH